MGLNFYKHIHMQQQLQTHLHTSLLVLWEREHRTAKGKHKMQSIAVKVHDTKLNTVHHIRTKYQCFSYNTEYNKEVKKWQHNTSNCYWKIVEKKAKMQCIYHVRLTKKHTN